MKPEKQRIAIAESLGWTFITWDARPHGLPPNGKHDRYTSPIPDYESELMVMRYAALHYLNSASSAQNWLYAEHLGRITGSGTHITTALIFASAEQHAEAFLRTIGKWEDEFPTSEEAKVILAEAGIDTTELKSWASGKLAEIKSRLPGISQEVGA